MNLAQTGTINQSEKRFSTQSAAFLLNKFGLLTVLAIMLIAAWSGLVVIVILLGLILSAAGLSRLWSRVSLTGVHCQRSLSEQRVFPDEHIDLKLRVVNRKLLPLPWLQVEDEIPLGFTPDTPLAPGKRTGFGTLSKSASIPWYSAVSWHNRLVCNKRGYYPLGPITVSSGDIFGFYPRQETEPLVEPIIVYPRLYTINQLGMPSLYPLGETKSDRRIFEDPSRTIGVRGYSPGDSLRRIHWKASARQQCLQVKVFEPTTTLKAAIFLAVDSFQKGGGICDEAQLELGISTAASMVSYLVEHGSQAGLWVNSLLADTGQPARISPRGGEGQLVTILEALAKVTPSSSAPFTEYLQCERRDLPLGTTLIFVIHHLPVELSGALTDLAENGYKLLVLQIGDEEKTGVDTDIAWYNIRHPGDLEKPVGSNNT